MSNFTRLSQLAVSLLKKHGLLEKPVNLIALAKEYDIRVVEAKVDSALSGALIREDRAQILINKSHSDNRKRFTLAHELAHFFLHPKQNHFIDAAPVYYRSSAMPSTALEREANSFAASLIMPENMVREALKGKHLDKKTVTELSNDFQVSEEAMLYHLMHLGYLVENN